MERSLSIFFDTWTVISHTTRPIRYVQSKLKSIWRVWSQAELVKLTHAFCSSLIILQWIKKCEIWPRFTTPVNFGALCTRKRTTCRKSMRQERRWPYISQTIRLHLSPTFLQGKGRVKSAKFISLTLCPRSDCVIPDTLIVFVSLRAVLRKKAT